MSREIVDDYVLRMKNLIKEGLTLQCGDVVCSQCPLDEEVDGVRICNLIDYIHRVLKGE